MRFYRCECGHSFSSGSIPPDPCCACPQCGSDLAESARLHAPVKPHRLAEVQESGVADSGVISWTVTRCIWCNRLKADIVASGEKWEDVAPGSR